MNERETTCIDCLYRNLRLARTKIPSIFFHYLLLQALPQNGVADVDCLALSEQFGISFLWLDAFPTNDLFSLPYAPCRGYVDPILRSGNHAEGCFYVMISPFSG